MQHLIDRLRQRAKSLLDAARELEAAGKKNKTFTWLVAHADALEEIANELDELRSTDMGRFADAINKLKGELATAQASAATNQIAADELTDLKASNLVADQADADAADSVNNETVAGGAGADTTPGGAAPTA